MSYLPPTRELRVRFDTAQALTRLFYGEQAIVLACGGWIPHVARLEAKTELARTAWESALAGDALRERVFELRYPSRFLGEQGEEATIVGPDDLRDLVTKLLDGYRSYLDVADALADGPSIRIVEAALRDKERQAEALWKTSRRTTRRMTHGISSPASTGPTRSIPTTRTAKGSRSSFARRSAT